MSPGFTRTTDVSVGVRLAHRRSGTAVYSRPSGAVCQPSPATGMSTGATAARLSLPALQLSVLMSPSCPLAPRLATAACARRNVTRRDRRPAASAAASASAAAAASPTSGAQPSRASKPPPRSDPRPHTSGHSHAPVSHHAAARFAVATMAERSRHASGIAHRCGSSPESRRNSTMARSLSSRDRSSAILLSTPAMW